MNLGSRSSRKWRFCLEIHFYYVHFGRNSKIEASSIGKCRIRPGLGVSTDQVG